MTREEIKKAMRDTKKEVVIKNLHELLSLVEDYPEYEDCISYAIEKLEQEPSEDCVSRKQMLDAITEIDENINMDIYTNEVREIIRDLPPVTPTRKKGKWIGHGEHCENLGVITSGLGAYEWCSNCDCGIDVREWHRNHYNYCPNCGAEMESEE